jgi:hypothetical protein
MTTAEENINYMANQWRNMELEQLPEQSEIKESGIRDSFKSKSYAEMSKAELKAYYAEYCEAENSVDFSFDYEEAMKSGVYCSGTTGTGKSDIGMYSAKALMKHGVIVVAFDSTQDWQTRSSIATVQTLTTPHIDSMPTVSTIFDISLLSATQRQRLIEDFNRVVYRFQALKKPCERQQYFLIFEEAHNYFKEGFMRSKRFSNSAMLLSEGRNYGVRFMCITQFANLLDKTAMKYMRLRFFGYSSEPNDTEYIARFFPKDDRDKIKETLRKLEAGEFLTMNGQTTYIKPFESNVVKKVITEKHTTELKQSKPRTTTDHSAFYRLIAIAVLGLVLLKMVI